jgi:hypothetical protein
LNNKDAVLEMLGRFQEDLVGLQRAIRFGDGEALHKTFSEARTIRRGVIQAGQDTAAPNFGRTSEPKGPGSGIYRDDSTGELVIVAKGNPMPPSKSSAKSEKSKRRG